MVGGRIHRSLPRGVEFVNDIRGALSAYEVVVIFDVGANVGQSSKIYLEKFPHCKIYCFEPVSETFRQLKENLGTIERIEFHQVALGSSRGVGDMVLQGGSDTFYLLPQAMPSLGNEHVKLESVKIDTLDGFCSVHKIDRISFLKIDTEGGDLEVLKGASSMLGEQKIDLVQVEAGMNPDNCRHVSFEVLKGFLESCGYMLFGIYDQVKEWPTGDCHLRRTNPVFISRRMIEESRK